MVIEVEKCNLKVSTSRDYVLQGLHPFGDNGHVKM
jgi:hypothetical protein